VLSSGVRAGTSPREAGCFGHQVVDDHGRGARARGDRVRHGRHPRAQVARGEEPGHAGVEHRVDLDGVDDDGPRAGGSRAELLGECGALVQGDGHEQSAARALAAVGESDGRQCAVRPTQPGDAALVDRDPRRAQPLGVLRAELAGPVGEQRHVVAPEAQQERPAHTLAAPVEHCQRLVADLPSVAERAVEHRAAPPLGESGERGEAVVHARGEHHAPRHLARAAGQLEQEARVVLLAAQDLAGPQLHGRVGRELVSPGGVELGRRASVVAEQAADARGVAVALASRIDDERPPSRAAEHQRSAQAGGPGSDDDAVPGPVHVVRVAAPPQPCQTDLP
jgi:hypothetical protein